MANTKEIRKQISSISNTQKITSAMEMVASSKMRKTQDRMEMGRPYADRMLSVIGHLANSNPEYKPLYMTERDAKNIGIIVVSSDKGLCGGLNINLFRNRFLNKFMFKPPHKPLSELTTMMPMFLASLSVIYRGLYSGFELAK